MYLAFIDIRESSLKGEAKVAFHLSDLFHNIPLALQAAECGEISYLELLSDLKQRSIEKGIDSWLDQNLADLAADRTNK